VHWAKLRDSMDRFGRPLDDTGGVSTAAPEILDVLQGFVHELRAAGLPVSMTENLDAMRAVEQVGLEDRTLFKSALAATLIKHHEHQRAFDTVFDVYFALVGPGADPDAFADDGGPPITSELGERAAGGGAMGDMDPAELARALLDALQPMDRDALRRLASMAVTMFAGMEPGRPVGGTYYLYRTLRQLDLDGMAAQLMDRRAAETGEVREGELADRLAQEEMQARLKELRDLIEDEIRRRLVEDRGVEAMARTLRKPLPEDVDFMHATKEEMAALQRAIYPLTRALAARLAQRRKRRNRGQLDFRKTVRQSLSYGGVPADPVFRQQRISRPEIMVVADISGSVASFARFTLQFVYAMASQFSKVRSWVFIDGIDEVTSFFQESDEITEAIHRVNTEAQVVWVDGHSDYGHAFGAFRDRHLLEITKKTSVILLGDARNNYHSPNNEVVKQIAARAKHVFWLNPEPRGYWDTGDSIVSQYGMYCDGVFECRNLRQLEQFVGAIIEG
jgi:uncharacterized protein with von Willebrand factor type A (vWA) domain